MNSQLYILYNSFSWISPKLNIRINISKNCIHQLKNIKLQIWMNFITKLQLLLSKVKYINLCKIWFFVKRKKKIAHKMIKNILYSKDINFYCIHNIDDDSIEFDAKKDEKYRVIVRSNVLLKIFNSFDSNDFIIDIDMSLSEKNPQRFKSIICNRQYDNILWTTHWKFRILFDEFFNTLLYSMKSIAMRIVNNCQKRYMKRIICDIHEIQWMSNIHQRIKRLMCK